LIGRGTAIEVIPEARPANAGDLDQRLFQARIVNPERLRGSVTWNYDDQIYSLSGLTKLLSERYGVRFLRSRTFATWRIEGHPQSMWDEAEKFPR
jgi:hypothetical protein